MLGLWLVAASCGDGFDTGPGCTNTCRFANDGDCDDGGPGSDFSLCSLGTDCNDCGPRSSGGGGGGGSDGCTNTCRFASDGDCDDGGAGSDFSLCDLGTDCNDCGPRSGGGGDGGGGDGQFSLTCHDAREGAEQCVHYTFTSEADRDSFYEMCAGLTSRTRDAHNCPSGATGNGFCRHTTSGRIADTYTYNGTESEIRQRCSSTGGTWL